MSAKMICGGCRAIIKDRRYLFCSVCKENYDLECANVSESRFYNTMSKEHKKEWRCIVCKSKEPKKDNTNTPVRPVDAVHINDGGTEKAPIDFDASVESVIDGVTLTRGPAVGSPVSLDRSLPDNMNDTAHNLTLEMTDFQSIIMEMRAFREEMRDELRANRVQIKLMNETLSMLSGRIKECESRIDKLEDRISTLEQREDHDAASIEHLRMELNDRDQDLLLNDVEISCIPEEKGESLPHIVATLASKLGVSLVEQDIVSATRVGRVLDATNDSAKSRPRHIAVRLARRAVRDQLLKAARVRRGATTEGTGLPGASRRFYVNERLTKINRQLFRRARELCDQQNWRYSWTREGRIFVREYQGEDAPRFRLRVEADLARVFGRDAVRPA